MEPNQQNKQASTIRPETLKNKLTVTRGDGGVGGDNGGKQGTVHQGTCIKDTRTKPKRVGSRVGGHGGVKMETTVLEQQLKLPNCCYERMCQTH